jgi:NAD(P)-dependent dehydrogenase (short-subunit alcohol dehydrogenase family)
VTKTAQLAVSRGLAEQTRETKVTVNCVLAGPTRSEGIVEFLKGLAATPNATPEQAERRCNIFCVNCFLVVWQMVSAVSFLGMT